MVHRTKQSGKEMTPKQARAYHRALRRMKLKRDANPEVYRERARKWRKANIASGALRWKEYYSRPEVKRKRKQYIKKNMLRVRCNKFGITPDEYNALLKSQNGRCAICQGKEVGRNGHSSWIIDHDHKTGRVRGLLCHYCNLALGLVKDNPKVLLAMAAYLKRS